MKTCTKCGLSKSQNEFYVKDSKTNRLHAQCKDCYKQHRKTYYKSHYTQYKSEYQLRAKTYRVKLRQEYRTNMIAYLSDKACEVCSESDMRVLELDHINPQDKLFSISQAVRLGYRWEDVANELKKCRVLCANCHKKHTATQYQWYKNI